MNMNDLAGIKDRIDGMGFDGEMAANLFLIVELSVKAGRESAIDEANQMVGALWSDLFNKDLVKAAGAEYFDRWRERIKALKQPIG